MCTHLGTFSGAGAALLSLTGLLTEMRGTAKEVDGSMAFGEVGVAAGGAAFGREEDGEVKGGLYPPGVTAVPVDGPLLLPSEKRLRHFTISS